MYYSEKPTAASEHRLVANYIWTNIQKSSLKRPKYIVAKTLSRFQSGYHLHQLLYQFMYSMRHVWISYWPKLSVFQPGFETRSICDISDLLTLCRFKTGNDDEPRDLLGNVGNNPYECCCRVPQLFFDMRLLIVRMWLVTLQTRYARFLHFSTLQCARSLYWPQRGSQFTTVAKCCLVALRIRHAPLWKWGAVPILTSTIFIDSKSQQRAAQNHIKGEGVDL